MSSIHINTWPQDCKQFKRRQFKITFANGWSVSAVYGTGLYSHDITGSQFTADFSDDCHASSVEVAIFDNNNTFVPFESSGDVKGWINADTLADIIAWTKSQPRKP